MRKGFTLIELLAVIVILAILVALAIPAISSIMKISKQKIYETNIKVIEKAAKTYLLSNPNETKVRLQTLVDDKFLDNIPEDPRNGDIMDGMVIFYNDSSDYKMSIYNGMYNTPEISKNMYPVKWNDSAWEVIDYNDSDWYTYNGDIDNFEDTNKSSGTGAFTIDRWANVQVSKENLSKGDLISEDDLNLYVWIPRYTYLLDESLKTIKIKYTDGVNDDIQENYLSHPGFTFGDQELTGIWVAKFEMSANTSSNDYGKPSGEATGVSAPNVKPWRYISVNDIFDEARTIETEFEINANSHMLKSSEWGAVAYLTEAIRDGEEVWSNNQGWYNSSNTTNNYKFLVTGCGSSTSKNAYDNNATSATCTSGYDYKTWGKRASTTGNIYGIYDMVGGSWEYMATYINDDTNSRLTSASYAKSLADSGNKYKDILDLSGTSSVNNYDNSINITQGLALHEISTIGTGSTSWYGDYSYFPYASNPFVLRGGRFTYGVKASLFAFRCDSGSGNAYRGWRASIVL